MVVIASLLRESLQLYLIVNLPKIVDELTEAAQILEITKVNNVSAVRSQAPGTQTNEQWSVRQRNRSPWCRFCLNVYHLHRDCPKRQQLPEERLNYVKTSPLPYIPTIINVQMVYAFNVVNKRKK